MSPVAILTRPEGRNEVLSDSLRNVGWEVLMLPALGLQPTDVTIADLPIPNDYDLVVFVSGYAMQAYIKQLRCVAGVTAWPSNVPMATVGPSSAKMLDSLSDFCINTTILCPPADAPTHDSEALWKVLQARELRPKRVLIVRSTHGRNWLSEQFAMCGVIVVRYAAYQRVALDWAPQRVSQLHNWAQQRKKVTWLLTSGEGVSSVLSNIRDAGLESWWSESSFIITHPTLRDRLPLKGDSLMMDATVKICLPADDAILAAFLAV